MTSPAILVRKETPWIDAWIRWDRGTTNDDDDDDDETDQVAPTDTFSFHYTGSAEQPDIIDIELQGFPSDSEQTWNSTGLTLWRSSEHLCNYFVKEWQNGTAATGNLFANNRRFLEVGSGLGRGGILALHCLSLTKRPCDDDDDDKEGSTLLCLTDGDTDVLHHLRNNVERNQPKQIQEMTNVKLVCSQLLWGRNHALEFLQHVDNQKFDVLFGSDLIYVTKVIQPLFETVSTLLAELGCFIMAHCARREGNEVDVDMIFEAALSFGLKHEIVEEDEDISVFIFRRKA